MRNLHAVSQIFSDGRWPDASGSGTGPPGALVAAVFFTLGTVAAFDAALFLFPPKLLEVEETATVLGLGEMRDVVEDETPSEEDSEEIAGLRSLEEEEEEEEAAGCKHTATGFDAFWSTFAVDTPSSDESESESELWGSNHHDWSSELK